MQDLYRSPLRRPVCSHQLAPTAALHRAAYDVAADRVIVCTITRHLDHAKQFVEKARQAHDAMWCTIVLCFTEHETDRIKEMFLNLAQALSI